MIVIHIIDYIFWGLMLMSCLYLLFFSVLSLKRTKKVYTATEKQSRYAVLFPAYKEDSVIVSSVSNFLNQTYPTDLYTVVVISDKMEKSTNEELRQLPIIVLEVNFENSSKAKALNFAIDSLASEYFDSVLIMDSDNVVEPDFLEEVNKAFAAGEKAIQAHRVAKNMNTDVSVLDAVSEEINNSIFRKGFSNMGFSATLSGSGMVFEYRWFKENIKKLISSGEDKEMEALLLQQGIHIAYLENVYVYDEKTQKSKAFYQQRRRWLAAQYGTLFRTLKDFPKALKSKNYDYCNKLIQWMMLPRLMLMGIVGLITIVCTVISWEDAIKWWGVSAVLLSALLLAVPRKMWNGKVWRAIWRIPILFMLMFANFFRMKGAYKSFSHTEHREV